MQAIFTSLGVLPDYLTTGKGALGIKNARENRAHKNHQINESALFQHPPPKQLGDLHGVQGRAFAQVIRHAP